MACGGGEASSEASGEAGSGGEPPGKTPGKAGSGGEALGKTRCRRMRINSAPESRVTATGYTMVREPAGAMGVSFGGMMLARWGYTETDGRVDGWITTGAKLVPA